MPAEDGYKYRVELLLALALSDFPLQQESVSRFCVPAFALLGLQNLELINFFLRNKPMSDSLLN